MIEVEHLTRWYGPLAAVRDLSFGVAPGEVLGLVGPNGAGKTTTLRALAGIVAPTSGRITIGGQDLARDPVAAKQLLAFIPDEPQLFDYLTVAEHLEFVARVYGTADGPARSRELLAEFELAERRDALPGELSRGMKQKLAIACGLLHEPSAIIFDEPLTGLDPVAIRRMKDLIRRRADAGAAVILSSHLLHLVEEVCSRVLILHRGRTAAEGSFADIRGLRPEFAEQSLEAIFLALIPEDGAGP